MFQEFMNTSNKRTIVVESENDRMIISFQTLNNGMTVDLSSEEADKLMTLLSMARADMQNNSTKELLGA